MLANYNDNYITVFAMILCNTTLFLLTELQDLGHATRKDIQDQNQGRP